MITFSALFAFCLSSAEGRSPKQGDCHAAVPDATEFKSRRVVSMSKTRVDAAHSLQKLSVVRGCIDIEVIKIASTARDTP